MRSRVLTALIAVFVCLLGTALLLPSSLFVVTAEAQVPVVPAEAPSPVIAAELPLIDVAMATAAGVSPEVLDMATAAVRCAVKTGAIAPPPTLTVIDYSRPSTDKRLWVFDLKTGQLRFNELVAHGKGTGDNLAEHFSDDMNSHQSSLGLFRTADTYVGHNGYSLRLEGLEPGFNSRARERAIVMHGAPYVNADLAAKQGRIGRSWGCPALNEAVAHRVIDFVRGGGVVFSYYPDQQWLKQSTFLNCPADPAGTEGTLLARNSAAVTETDVR